MTQPFIVFTDLDGTLLDYSTYSFEPALPALNYLRTEQIPLILMSSKTNAEIIYYQKKLDLVGTPFVVENGSAIYSEEGFFKSINGFESHNDFSRYCLGDTYASLKIVIEKISAEYDYTIRGFHNASVEEIRERTGLPQSELSMALHREFSIPLFFDSKAEDILNKEIDRYNLQILYGGRFMHLLSKVDKGTAMQIILDGYRDRFGHSDLKSIALGDSLNDFAMLSAANLAVLVKKYDGTYEQREIIENVVYSPGIGPEGWNLSLLNILQDGGKNE